MKKIACIFMVFILFLTACGSEAPPSQRYGIQPPIDRVTWGMSDNDFISAVGGEYDRKDGEQGEQNLIFKNKIKIFGEEAQLQAGFFYNYDIKGEKLYKNLGDYILTNVVLKYSEEDAKKVEQAIKEKYGETDLRFFSREDMPWYISKETIKDIKEKDLREKVIEGEGLAEIGSVGEMDELDRKTTEQLPLNGFYTMDGCQGMVFLGYIMVGIANAEKELNQ